MCLSDRAEGVGSDAAGQMPARAIACCHPVVVPEPSASLGISTGVFALLALNAMRG